MLGKIKSLIVASLFPLIYFLSQILVQITFVYGASYYLGMETAVNIANKKIYILTLCSALLCFVLLIILNRIRRQNLFDHYNAVGTKKIIFYVFLTLVMYFTIVILNGLLIDFFPEYNEQIMGFFQIEQPILGIFVIGIIAPLIEELIFRGEVYKELEKNFSAPLVILIQALLFGFMHQIPLQRIQTFIIGLFFGSVRAKTKNIWPSTIMHITSNMIASILVFLML